MPILHICAISSVSRGGHDGSFCAIFWIEARGHCPVKIFSWPAKGLIDFLVGITDWDGLLSNFCTILGHSIRLIPWFHSVDYLGGNLKLYIILGSNTWSLRGETMQCSINAGLAIGGWSGWQSFGKMTKFVNEWTCACMTLWTHTQHDVTIRHLKPTRQHAQFDSPTSAGDKCNTCDRSLNDHDDTCTTLHTTSCVSATDDYIVNTTCTHKDKREQSQNLTTIMTLWQTY